MSRIQCKRRLLIAVCLSVLMSACNEEKVMTVGDYMHDPVLTMKRYAECKSEGVKAGGMPSASCMNAFDAKRFMSIADHAKCYGYTKTGIWNSLERAPDDFLKTATADHTCVDAAGYIRSK